MRLPRFLQVEPVGQCNLRCRMCPIQFRRDGPPHGPPAFMDFDLFARLLDQFADLEELQLQGLGEPMMHPRFFDMISLASGRGIKVSTNTNLTLLTASRAERCVTSGLAELHASIDGATAETYERIRVRARFDRIVRNLAGLVKARERLASATPRIRMVVVAMRQNLPEFPDLVRLAHRLGIDSVFVQHLCHDFGESSLPPHYRPMRDFVEGETLVNEDQDRVARYFGEARDLARELEVDLRLPATQPKPHPPGTPGPKRCDWPWRGAYVSYQGLSMPCCMVSTPDRINLGDMAAEGAGKVWSGEPYQSFREALSSESPPEVCRSCAIYSGTF
ncbi:radical SAM protein [Tautonia plasticadhaerens]|uniref:Pyrroloquinoline quinone biosynthesis protein PqqE n=1 Tax=Tautonia plasticadhaerens TaxID=2527974 RepID=A0A518H608_9BACT|nr:radical SAM protein [Tautonia plasticadhaerens]QDV36275.1 pyrroloquinoline quinone biosynthesis protein PqqE [Tautonia plasticadhaerens]